MLRRLLVILALVSACAGAPEGDPPRSGKPQPPVDVVLEARPLGGDRFAVALEGRALAELDELSLELVVPGEVARRRTAGEPTARGGARRLETEVHAPVGTTVRGVARTPMGPRAVTVRLGVPAQKPTIAPAERVVMTPLGPVAEAR